MSISDRYLRLQEKITEKAIQCGRNPKEITLVAVSKTVSVEQILEVYHAGCRDFGENRLQEAMEKIPQLPDDIRWHFIGTLQRNKVRKAIGGFSLIHSVDSVALAEKVSHCSEEMGDVTPILLQANTSGEETKNGLAPQDWKKEWENVQRLSGIRIDGLMTMAPFVKERKAIAKCFAALRRLRDEIAPNMHLSMGMTHDYRIAIEEGATILRIGSGIFAK